MAERKQGPVKPPVIDLTPTRAATRSPRTARATRADAEDTPVPSEPAPTGAETAEVSAEAQDAIAASTGTSGAPEPTAEPIPVAEPRREEPLATEDRPAPPEPAMRPRPTPPPQRMPNAPLYITAIAGALIGTVLTLGLAGLGLFPSSVPAPGPDPAIAMQGGRIETLETGLASLDASVRTALGNLDSRISADTEAMAALRTELRPVGTELAPLKAELEALRAAIPPAADLAPVSAEIAALSGRVDALAAGAPAADAGAFAATLATLQQSLAELDQRVATLAATQQQLTDGATAIDSRIAALEAAPQPQTTAEVAAVAEPSAPAAPVAADAAGRLPLVISGLESAFAAGRPYAGELDALRPLLPELALPEEVASQAAAGLPRPAAIVAAFDAAVPSMLAARPVTQGADWQQTATDWVASLLALRPTEEREGDTPDAVLSRLEGAMRRGDFAAATTLFAALPEPMRQAAGEVPQQVAKAAAAAGLVAELRRIALQPAEGVPQ